MDIIYQIVSIPSLYPCSLEYEVSFFVSLTYTRCNTKTIDYRVSYDRYFAAKRRLYSGDPELCTQP